jgi:uncharacterized SAM-binding protein YcdF (DUF218 family)
MFYFFKVLETIILPPGIFILLLIVSGIFLLYKTHFKTGVFNLSIGLLLWLLSIFPVSHFLLNGLESSFSIPKSIEGDVIILLGAGLRDKVPDLTGSGFPGGDMLGRIVTAVRLQKQYNIPIIITSGKVYKGGSAGAPVDRRILVDLGVDAKNIIVEEKSRNTIENAKYSAIICQEMGYKKPVLLTAAYHLKRSQMAFQKVGLTTIPFPAYRNSSENPIFFWHSFLPRYNTFEASCTAIREYLGILYYKLCY